MYAFVDLESPRILFLHLSRNQTVHFDMSIQICLLLQYVEC